MTLSDTQTSILQQAAQHPDGLVVSPTNLPPGPRASIARALLNAGLAERAEASDGSISWKLDGEVIGLTITSAGREAIGGVAGELPPAPLVPNLAAGQSQPAANERPTEPEATPSRSQTRPKLRDAATTLLACWDGTTERAPLAEAVAALRAALDPASRQATSTRPPRQGTKQQAVLSLLRRPEGATIASVVEATGWAQHTVRGFFAGLKKKGHSVEVLDRLRQIGPGNAGAKGSYSVYRLGEAG